MVAILLIVGVSMLIFVVLAVMMKRTDPERPAGIVEEKQYACGICQEEFPESEMIHRKVGDAGYTRWFCDRCVVDLYQESREMHDPRSKETNPSSE